MGLADVTESLFMQIRELKQNLIIVYCPSIPRLLFAHVLSTLLTGKISASVVVKAMPVSLRDCNDLEP